MPLPERAPPEVSLRRVLRGAFANGRAIGPQPVHAAVGVDEARIAGDVAGAEAMGGGRFERSFREVVVYPHVLRALIVR